MNWNDRGARWHSRSFADEIDIDPVSVDPWNEESLWEVDEDDIESPWWSITP